MGKLSQWACVPHKDTSFLEAQAFRSSESWHVAVPTSLSGYNTCFEHAFENYRERRGSQNRRQTFKRVQICRAETGFTKIQKRKRKNRKMIAQGQHHNDIRLSKELEEGRIYHVAFVSIKTHIAG